MATVTVFNEGTGTNWTINITMETAVINGSSEGKYKYYIKVSTSQKADGETIAARIIEDIGYGVGEVLTGESSLSTSRIESSESGWWGQEWGVTQWVNQAIQAILVDSNESASSSSTSSQSSSSSST